MDGDSRRPRMRGLRRGVRVRGGRGGPGGPPPVVVVVEAEVAAAGARGSRTTRARGRGQGRGRTERPGPRTADELTVSNIQQLPEGQGLEVPLHPHRKRIWQPSNPALPPPPQAAPSGSAAPPPPQLAPPSPTPSGSSVPPPSPSSYLVPSPALFEECGGASAPSSMPASPLQMPTPSPRQRRPLLECDISRLLNFGSDEESDDDEDVLGPVFSRVYQSLQDTPLDEDEVNAGEEDVSGLEPPVEQDLDVVVEEVPIHATERPWEVNEFDWRPFPNAPIPPESMRETFSQINVGPTTPSVDPYDIFIEIWDRQIMEHIAEETNRYAQQLATQMLEGGNLHPQSRINNWKDTNVDELYVYFALILGMGIVVKSRLEEYWVATADLLCTPGFSAHMTIDRFLLLTRCLHFNDNEGMWALNLGFSDARLYKIEPILSHLNKKFQALYIPARNLALDESLLMWKGWLDICQLIPNKAAQRGIKSYEICESQTGYLWKFKIHAHKKSSPQVSQDPLQASTPAIVLELVQGLEAKGYTLWMDNFYQSPCLARRLKSIGIDCVGTLRTDRKFVPQALHTLTKRSMRQGEICSLTSGDVDVMVWRDTNRVAMISTYHGNAQQTLRGSTKPILILDYNIMMGGVDKKDQLLAMYPIERKRTKVWYKKLFRRFINISVLNAFIIHRHNSSGPSSSFPSSLAHRAFRINLIRSLLSKHSSSSLTLPARKEIQVDETT